VPGRVALCLNKVKYIVVSTWNCGTTHYSAVTLVVGAIQLEVLAAAEFGARSQTGWLAAAPGITTGSSRTTPVITAQRARVAVVKQQQWWCALVAHAVVYICIASKRVAASWTEVDLA
jgi:hypothetical protein